jgi:regulator of protease activity HflC (stomatin/prohibitin superfamily)
MKQLALLSLLFLVTSCGFEVVDTGYRGVQTEMGKVVGGTLEEGMHWYNPMTSDIIEMDVRVQTRATTITCYTKDLQMANIEISSMIFPKKDSVHLIYKDIGMNWDEKLVTPIVNGTVKTVIGKWDAVDLIANREKARAEIEEQLKVTLDKSFIEVSNVELVNVDYADEFEKSVERKVVAIQSAIEAQNKTKQIEEEAKQRIISAEAEAKSMKIRSEALSQNKGLVQYEMAIRWDGHYPKVMMGNSGSLVQLPHEILK